MKDELKIFLVIIIGVIVGTLLYKKMVIKDQNKKKQVQVEDTFQLRKQTDQNFNVVDDKGNLSSTGLQERDKIKETEEQVKDSQVAKINNTIKEFETKMEIMQREISDLGKKLTKEFTGKGASDVRGEGSGANLIREMLRKKESEYKKLVIELEEIKHKLKELENLKASSSDQKGNDLIKSKAGVIRSEGKNIGRDSKTDKK